jgi:hypothetical protein
VRKQHLQHRGATEVYHPYHKHDKKIPSDFIDVKVLRQNNEIRTEATRTRDASMLLLLRGLLTHDVTFRSFYNIPAADDSQKGAPGTKIGLREEDCTRVRWLAN